MLVQRYFHLVYQILIIWFDVFLFRVTYFFHLFQLPCVELDLPAECVKDGEKSPFSAPAAEEEDDWGDDSWGEKEEEKSEKSADKVDAKQAEDKPVDIEVPDFVVSDVA